MNKKLGLVILTSSLMSFLMCSCGNSNPPVINFDGKEYDVSLLQDNSLLATSTKKENGYELAISGNGRAIDYSRKEEVPWNPIARLVNDVIVEVGIENIGDYFFYSVPVEAILLPQSVTSVGEHSFNSLTTVYTYGATIDNIPNDVYYYSPDKPTVPGNYFYVEDGTINKWPPVSDKEYSFLFIGNSFTWRQGSLEDPTVPKFFNKIATNLGIKTKYDFVVESSYTLAKYADPTDRLGKIVEEKLTTKKFDYVILQEQSTTPLNSYNNFLNAVKKLKQRIDETQTGCKTVLYETWGSPTGIEGTSYKTVGEMELALRNAYKTAAEETGCSVNYVGKAFTYAYEVEHINIYAEDNRHQSNLGAYLSAACHVRSIFKVQVAKCTDYCGLLESECKAVLGVADKTC